MGGDSCDVFTAFGSYPLEKKRSSRGECVTAQDFSRFWSFDPGLPRIARDIRRLHTCLLDVRGRAGGRNYRLGRKGLVLLRRGPNREYGETGLVREQMLGADLGTVVVRAGDLSQKPPIGKRSSRTVTKRSIGRCRCIQIEIDREIAVD